MARPPVPAPVSEEVRLRMSRQPKRDTLPELALRRALHARRLRFFIDRPVLEDGRRRRADIVFPRWRLAVFVDGCFWHGCPEHGHVPGHNSGWWQVKLDRNRARDRDTDSRLAAQGWGVTRVWEHETAEQAAGRVVAALVERGWPGALTQEAETVTATMSAPASTA